MTISQSLLNRFTEVLNRNAVEKIAKRYKPDITTSEMNFLMSYLFMNKVEDESDIIKYVKIKYKIK